MLHIHRLLRCWVPGPFHLIFKPSGYYRVLLLSVCILCQSLLPGTAICPLHQVTLFRSQDIFAALTPQRESGSHFHVPFHLPLTNHLRNSLWPQKLCLPFSPKTVPQRPHLTVAGTAPEQPHSLYKGTVLNLDCHNWESTYMLSNLI